MNSLNLASLIFFCTLFCFSGLGQSVIYVNANVQAGSQNGTSWANAFADLQQALDIAQPDDEIWVAGGAYFPTTGLDRNASFEIPSGVALYGGFSGIEQLLEQRDWEEHETILSGDIGVQNDSTDNAFTVVYFAYSDSTTLLDGFSIIGGNANSSIPVDPVLGRTKSGGGIYIDGSGAGQFSLPHIKNCQVSHNAAALQGGGIFFNSSMDGSASPIIENCLLEYNTANRGGCIFLERSGNVESHNKILNCEFNHNDAISGGVLYYFNASGTASLEITGCQFNYNTGRTGGVIYNEDQNDNANLKIRQCSFMGNDALQAGAILSTHFFGELDDLDLEISGSEFLFNHANSSGGALQIFGSQSIGRPSNIIIRNCLFRHNNEDGDGGGAILMGGIEKTTIANSLFERNTSNNGAALNFFDNDTCRVYGCTFFANLAQHNGGAFTLNTGLSQMPFHQFFSNCIFQENTSIDNPDSSLGELNHTGELSFDHCLFDSNTCDESINGSAFVSIDCGAGNLFDEAPLFVNPNQSDFRLQPCSPARNAGNNATSDSNSTDLDGKPRILESIVDMGAYETPAYTVTIDTIINVTCHGESTGGVEIGVLSGCAPFVLVFSGASSVAETVPVSVLNLPAGIHDFIITDAQGRQANVQATIGQPDELVSLASVTGVDCANGMLGVATAEVSGGTPFGNGGYTYLWSGGSSESTLTNLLPGSYALTVTDSLGCPVLDSFWVETNGELGINGLATDLACHGDSTGIVSATPSNGVPPFAWEWLGGQTGSTLSGLSAGSYSTTISDAIGCSGTAMLTVGQPDSLTLQIAAPPVVCTENGTAIASASGGTEPYSFTWDTGETEPVLMNIGTGIYTATVTDAHGCSGQQSVEIAGVVPVELTFTIEHASSATAQDGAIHVTDVLGSIAPFSFLWNTGATTQSLENVPPGDYELTVTDSLGCGYLFFFSVDIEVAVKQVLANGLVVEIFPNPAVTGGRAWLRFDGQQAQNLEVELWDMAGRLVQAEQVYILPGVSRHGFFMPDAAGLYRILVKDETGDFVNFNWVLLGE